MRNFFLALALFCLASANQADATITAPGDERRAFSRDLEQQLGDKFRQAEALKRSIYPLFVFVPGILGSEISVSAGAIIPH